MSKSDTLQIGLFRHIKPAYFGMSFIWACGMMVFRSSFPFQNSILDVPLQSVLMLIIAFPAAIITMAVISVKEIQQRGYAEALPAGMFMLVVVAGLLALSFSDAGTAGMILFVIGASLIGAGDGFFWGRWFALYGRLYPSLTAFIVPLNYILAIAFYLLISYAGDLLRINPFFIVVVLPVLSWLCLERAEHEVARLSCDGLRADGKEKPWDGSSADFRMSGMTLPARDVRSDFSSFAMPFSSIWKPLVSATFLAFMFGFIWEASVVSVGSVGDAHRLPLFASLVTVLVILLILVIAHRRWDISMMYRYTAPLIAIVFLFFPFAYGQSFVLLNSLMNVGFSVFLVILWSMVAETAYDYRVCGFAVAAVARAACLLPRLLGIVGCYLLFQAAGTSMMMVVFASVFFLYLLGLWLWWMKRKKKVPLRVSPTDGESAEAASDSSYATDGSVAAGRPIVSAAASAQVAGSVAADAAVETGAAGLIPDVLPEDEPDHKRMRFRESCALVAETYGLTTREAEVLPYLAQGRSAPVIAEELYVSVNTIRTHIRHILEKTGVESKEGLIDFVSTRHDGQEERALR